jgi:demethylmenaquinone methyltransferase/2-methoxy-6-polyprenyl-1,4-benzoquinol methylase
MAERRDSEAEFGFSKVRIEEKQGLVDDVFHKVAGRYDLMNDVMSAGLHRLWKSALVSALRPPPGRHFAVLDVAGGTGDVALRIAEAGGAQTAVTVLDINGEMLAVGRDRAARRFGEGRVGFVQGNAEALPCQASRFDAVTIAFGIRNVPRIEAALSEFRRVLRVGGRLMVLEFAPVDTPVLDRLYEAYSFAVIPALGRLFVGDAEPYRYLVESIRRFPRPARFAAMIEAAGFRRVTHRPLSGGIVNLHSAWKL